MAGAHRHCKSTGTKGYWHWNVRILPVVWPCSASESWVEIPQNIGEAQCEQGSLCLCSARILRVETPSEGFLSGLVQRGVLSSAWCGHGGSHRSTRATLKHTVLVLPGILGPQRGLGLPPAAVGSGAAASARAADGTRGDTNGSSNWWQIERPGGGSEVPKGQLLQASSSVLSSSPLWSPL